MRRVIRCSLIIALVCLACFMGAASGAATPADASANRDTPATVEDILSRVRSSIYSPPRMGFRQVVKIWGLLGRYEFTATVVKSAEGARVEAKGAPSFISVGLLADLADFEKAMRGFSLEYKGMVEEGKSKFLLIEGKRKPGLTTGATEGSLWIDPDTFQIRRTDARYPWGRIRVDHAHKSVPGGVVLERQDATIWPLATRLTVSYLDYWFAE